MANTLCTPAEYPAVRAALDLSINEVNLPDSIIGLSTHADRADEEVKRRDPDYASRGADDTKRLKRAAIYLCASYIAPSIPDITQETIGERQSYTRKAMDWPSRAIELVSDADREISIVLTGGKRSTARPPFFDVASGRRGEV